MCGDSTHGHDAKYAIARGAEGIPGPALGRRKDLGRVAVEDGIHDVCAKAEGAVPSQQCRAVERSRGAVEEDAGEDGKDTQSALAADLGKLDQDASDESAGNAEDRDDEAVAVGDVGAAIPERGAPGGLDVGEKGVVERIAEADESPDGHDEAGAQGQVLGGEERADLLAVELLEIAPGGSGGVRVGHVALGLAGAEVMDGQVRGGAVTAGNLVHDPNGVLVAALAHEILGTLVYGEEEEAREEHEHGDAAHGEDKVAPAHVVGLGARLLALGTGEAAEQRPGDEAGNDLGDGPVDGENGEEELVRLREELEEDGRVDGEVAAHAEGPHGGKDTGGGEGRGASGDQAPDGGEAKGKVEGPFAAKDVASEAPEDGAGEQADVLGHGEQWRARGIELVGDGCKDERGDDGPEVVAGPAEADDDEELPLIPSHADVADLAEVRE